MNRHQSLYFFFCLMVSLAGSNAYGGGVDTSDPGLPVVNVPYLSPTNVFASYHGPGLAIVLSAAELVPITAGSHTPSGADEIENFNATMDGLVSVNGSPGQPGTGSGSSQWLVHGKNGNVTGTFNTEMPALNIAGSSSFGAFLLRESPTLPSTGQTTISDIGGGQFHIDSFFDVFTELSIDGGNTWIPSDTSSHIDLNPSVPEPTTLFLFAIGAISLLGYRKAKS